MMDLSGKNIFVSGASSGIGCAIAVAAGRSGGTLYITGRNEARLKETLSLAGGKNHCHFPADLNEEKNIASLIDSLPPLDGIVHCAGIANPMPAKFITKKHIGEIFNTNFFSHVLLTSGLLHKTKINKKASIVFISSVSTIQPFFGGGMYMSSKAATDAYCKSLAFELASQKIRANCISPALVKTGIYDAMKAAVIPENLNQYENKYPLGLGEPRDVAEMAVFLLSEKSRWITGMNMIMDGGLLLNTKTPE